MESTPTRERIVEAALSLFAEQGFDATSVNQVVERAQVAKGALYHYFTSKDDLLYEVYRELIERQLAHLDVILDGGHPATETLTLIIADLIETTADRALAAKVFARESNRMGDENQQRMRAARRRYHDSMIELVRRGQSDGSFSHDVSAEMATFSIFGFINTLPLWYRPDGGKKPSDIAGELISLVLNGLVLKGDR